MRHGSDPDCTSERSSSLPERGSGVPVSAPREGERKEGADSGGLRRRPESGTRPAVGGQGQGDGGDSGAEQQGAQPDRPDDGHLRDSDWEEDSAVVEMRFQYALKDAKAVGKR